MHMYLLMNKDHIVAAFLMEEGILSDKYSIVSAEKEQMPIGFQDIESWLANRKGSKHNEHLRTLMKLCGCEKTEGFIRITHAATINDTFWVKRDTESATWSDISLYRNPFNDVISRLAFEGIGLYGIQLSSSSPELSTEGSFRKCWRRENDEIFLYKRGQSGARNMGLEPYCEAMGSEIAGLVCKHSVPYQIVRLHGELASRCRLFTDEQTGYVPFSRFHSNRHSADHMLAFYERIGSEDDFRRMIVLDALTFNVDRHAGNHGVLIDNDTLQPLRMAPVFDMNLSLLPYMEREDFQQIGNRLLECGPRIGDDFTRIGQAVLTPEIRKTLIPLKDFTFSFRGDQRFPLERVKLLEELVCRQAQALLSKEKLYTKDVFVPTIQPVQIPEAPKTDERRHQEELADQLGQHLTLSSYFYSFNLNIEEDHIDLILYPTETEDISFYINMSSFDIWMEKGGLLYPLGQCTQEAPFLADAYRYAENFIKEYKNI